MARAFGGANNTHPLSGGGGGGGEGVHKRKRYAKCLLKIPQSPKFFCTTNMIFESVTPSFTNWRHFHVENQWSITAINTELASYKGAIPCPASTPCISEILVCANMVF